MTEVYPLDYRKSKMEDAEQVDWFPVFRSLIRRPTVWWKGEGWA